MSFAARAREVVSGNPKTNAEALYDRNRGILERAVRSACGLAGLRDDQWEDAFSHARLGLWNATLRYDPARGAAFPSFAWWHIRGELSHYFRALERMREMWEIELDAPLGDGEFTRRDLLADDQAERPGFRLLAETGFEALVEALPPRQEACVRRLYQEREPLTALAEEWGVSRAAVSAMHTRALKQVRQSFCVE